MTKPSVWIQTKTWSKFSFDLALSKSLDYHSNPHNYELKASRKVSNKKNIVILSIFLFKFLWRDSFGQQLYLFLYHIIFSSTGEIQLVS